MRRRDKPTDRTVGALPPELAIGRLIEVWSGHPPAVNPEFEPWYSAWRNWSLGRQGLGQKLPHRAGGAPWAIDYCDRKHCPAYADQRLRRAGVGRADIPTLGRSAGTRLSTIERAER